MGAVLIAILVLPLAASVVCLKAPMRAAKAVSLTSGVATFGLALVLVSSHQVATALSGWLRADALSVVFLLAVSFLYGATTVFAVGYLRPAEGPAEARYSRRFFAGLNLFAWAMAMAPIVNGLALLWVAIEVTTVVSALLVAIGDTDGAVEAAWKYVLIASMGLGIALLATVFMYYAGSTVLGGSYEIFYPKLLGAAPHLPPEIVRLSFGLAVLGFGTKMGLVPVHTWLPDAHSEAPTPVSALLSGALLTVSFYAILRFYQVSVRAIGPAFPRDVLLVFGLASLVLAALYLASQRDLKRLLAYSSVEHMGILAIGMSFSAPIAMIGVLLHVLAHAAAKSTAFFGAGNVIRKFGTQGLGPNPRRRRSLAVERADVPPRRSRLVGNATVRHLQKRVLDRRGRPLNRSDGALGSVGRLRDLCLLGALMVCKPDHGDTHARQCCAKRSECLDGRVDGDRPRRPCRARRTSPRPAFRALGAGGGRARSAHVTPQAKVEWVDPHALAVTVAERVSRGDRFAGLFATAQGDGSTLIRALLAGRGLLDIVQARLGRGAGRYPALTPLVPPASWYEREIHDLFGIEPDGHPRLDPLLLAFDANEHRRPQPGVAPMAPITSLKLDNSALPSRVAGQGLFTIPYGPVRSGVFESVEYIVETFGEDIAYLRSRVHYKHRGIESRFGDLGPDDGVLLAERVEGTASVAHAIAYCQALETLGGVEVPPRAALVRVVHAELERVASHLDSVARNTEGAGQSVAYARMTLHKERLQRLRAQLCGHRFGRGVVVPGGVAGPLLVSPTEALVALRVLEHAIAG